MNTFALLFLLWLPWFWLMIFFHELAHFVTGRALGLAPYALVVGRGPLLFSGRVYGALVKLHLMPGYGLVIAPSRDSGQPMWKHVVFFGAGLVSDCVLLALLCVVMFKGGFGLAPGATLAPLAFVHAMVILANLMPMDVKIEQLKLPNDGKLMWQTLRGGTAYVAQRHRDLHVAAVRRYDPDFSAGQAWIDGAAPEVLELYEQGMAAQEAGDVQAGAEKLERVFAAVAMSPGEEACMLDTLASRVLYDKVQALYPAALQWAARSRALMPDCVTLRGTHGALLVDSGAAMIEAAGNGSREQALAAIREGLALLLPLAEDGQAPIDRLISTRYIARAHELLDDQQQAAEWKKRRRANEAAPPPWANQKVSATVRLGAIFLLLCAGIACAVAVHALVREGLPYGIGLQGLVMLLLGPYMSALVAHVAIRGRAPSGWIPFR